jgi:hypothetical protein
MTVSKQSQDGTGFVTAGIDRLFSWGMTYGMCHGSADIRDYVHLCFVVK